MPMRDYGKVDRGQVHAFGFDVMFKNCRIVTGIEKDASATDLDQRRVAPIFLKAAIFAKGVK